MPKYHAVRLDGKEYRLRVTVSGLQTLTQKHNIDSLGLFAGAAGRTDVILDILEQALNWSGEANTNEIRDPREFYDLLVDNGYIGIPAFNALMMDISAVSGVFTRDYAGRTKAAVSRMYEKEMDQYIKYIEKDAGNLETAEGPDPSENPTPAQATG